MSSPRCAAERPDDAVAGSPAPAIRREAQPGWARHYHGNAEHGQNQRRGPLATNAATLPSPPRASTIRSASAAAAQAALSCAQHPPRPPGRVRTAGQPPPSPLDSQARTRDSSRGSGAGIDLAASHSSAHCRRYVCSWPLEGWVRVLARTNVLEGGRRRKLPGPEGAESADGHGQRGRGRLRRPSRPVSRL